MKSTPIGRVALLVTLHLHTTLSIKVSRKNCFDHPEPIELGEWRTYLLHMDSVTVEHKPVVFSEGLVYVYENEFPNQTIKYIHVDNLAKKTCGAAATVKEGGVGKSSVLIVLYSKPHHEIRSVIDIWGSNQKGVPVRRSNNQLTNIEEKIKDTVKSRYLLKDMKYLNTVNYQDHHREVSQYK